MQRNSSEVSQTMFTKVNLNKFTFSITCQPASFISRQDSTVFNPKEKQHENSIGTLETKPSGYPYNPCLLKRDPFLAIL
jgi:hypothetical protein